MMPPGQGKAPAAPVIHSQAVGKIALFDPPLSFRGGSKGRTRNPEPYGVLLWIPGSLTDASAPE